MAPQRVGYKKLSQHTKKIGVTKILGGLMFCTVLAGQLGAGAAMASSGRLSIDSFRGESEFLAIAILEGEILHQSDPDCKYPPCD